MIALLAFPHALAAEPWALVAAYESALLAPKPAANMDDSVASGSAMSSSLGLEARRLASGEQSALALIVKRPASETSATGRHNLRVLFGDSAAAGEIDPRKAVYLEPAVLGRNLSVTIEHPRGAAHEANANLIRHQLAQMLLLEECVGRAWIGVDGHAKDSEALLREAMLLKTSDSGLYYHDDVRPVPTLLTPSLACEVAPTRAARAAVAPRPGAFERCPAASAPRNKAFLSDAWLSGCEDERSAEGMALTVTLGAQADGRTHGACVDVGAAECSPITLAVSGMGVSTRPPPGNLTRPTQAGGEAVRETRLSDILAQVPALYPSFTDPEGVYVVLLIPAWQISAAWRLHREQTGSPEQTQDAALQADPVHWLLTHPQWIQIIVQDTGSGRWGTVSGELFDTPFELRIGDPAGLRGVEAPVLSPGLEQVIEASVVHRRGPLVLTLCSAALSLGFLLGGARRLRELTLGPPVERIMWWPEVGSGQQEPATRVASEEAGESA